MRGWRGLGLVSGWQLAASLCFYAVFAATAFVRETFGVSRALVGVAVTATILGYTLFLFPMGALVDGYGERPTMVLGVVGLALGVVGVAGAPNFPLLLGALLVVGAMYASAMPATNRAVLAVAPPGHRNLAMNVKQVGVTVGSGLSALLVTGAATTHLGWRGGFVVAGAVALVVGVAFWRRYPVNGGSGSMSWPKVGMLLSNGPYRALVLSGLFFGAAIFTTSGYVVLHMTEAVGASAGVAGTVLAVVQVAGSSGRLGGGAIADRIPGSNARANALVLLGQGVLGAACFVAVTLVETPLTATAAFVGLGLFVFGFPGLYYGCMTALVSEERVGSATAVGQLTINVGGLVAPPTFGYLVDTASYDVGWLAMAACAGVAAVLTARVLVSSGE